MGNDELLQTGKKLYLDEGKSCSEAVLLAVKKTGLVDIPDALIHSVSGLRAGMGGSGCVCGALMASALIAGYLYGEKDPAKAAQFSADLHDKFKGKFKSTCCRSLTRKFEFKSRERKEFCADLVENMLSELIESGIITPGNK